MVNVELLIIGSIRIWMTVARLFKLELAFLANYKSYLVFRKVLS